MDHVITIQKETLNDALILVRPLIVPIDKNDTSCVSSKRIKSKWECISGKRSVKKLKKRITCSICGKVISISTLHPFTECNRYLDTEKKKKGLTEIVITKTLIV